MYNAVYRSLIGVVGDTRHYSLETASVTSVGIKPRERQHTLLISVLGSKSCDNFENRLGRQFWHSVEWGMIMKTFTSEMWSNIKSNTGEISQWHQDIGE